MQAHMFIGGGSKTADEEIERFVHNNNLQRFDFELAKIDQVRELGKFVKLHRRGIAIVVKDIDQSTNEALNAFLKHLEEPQEELYYLLTAKSEKGVLPTILSRCQITRLGPAKSDVEDKESKDFANLNVGEKLRVISIIKDRSDAINFVSNYIQYLRMSLRSDAPSSKIIKNLESSVNSLNNLENNGNINLQLTNFAINLV